MTDLDVTNEIRRRRGKNAINPYVIEGFEGPGPMPLSQPGTDPIVDLGDDEDPPPGAQRLTTRELINATATPLSPGPSLMVLDQAARVGPREVMLGPDAVKKITAIVLKEMVTQAKAELDTLKPRRARKKKT